MTAPEPTPLERAYAAADAASDMVTPPDGVTMEAWVDEHGPLAYRRGAVHAAAEALLAGDWLERVLAETSPCVWSIREENHPYGRACLDEHPDRHPGVGFCWVRPKKQAAAIRATAGVGL